MLARFTKGAFCLCLLAMTAYPITPRARVQEATVTLTQKGYQPGLVRLKQGIPARITFVRRFEATCATEVIIPEYGIRRELPMNQPVTVEFNPTKTGEIGFTCSMKMVSGKFKVSK